MSDQRCRCLIWTVRMSVSAGQDVRSGAAYSFKQTGIRRRILGSSCYPAFYRGHQRVGSETYWRMMRLRKIWAEGSFSVLKREHCLSKAKKRGIPAVTEECLLSVMALNLKRMVKAIFLSNTSLKSGSRIFFFDPDFFFVNRSRIFRKLVCRSWRE